MSGYKISERDIAAVIRYLKIHNPDNANQEYAIQVLELMHEIAKELVSENLKFAELFLQALERANKRNSS